jgi:hypothetical protein
VPACPEKRNHKVPVRRMPAGAGNEDEGRHNSNLPLGTMNRATRSRWSVGAQAVYGLTVHTARLGHGG